jgi:hypothetical protein
MPPKTASHCHKSREEGSAGNFEGMPCIALAGFQIASPG